MMALEDLSPAEQDCAALWAAEWLRGHGLDSELVTGAEAVDELRHHLSTRRQADDRWLHPERYGRGAESTTRNPDPAVDCIEIQVVPHKEFPWVG